jgi:hypothetical protein
MRFLTRELVEGDHDALTFGLHHSVYLRHLEDIAGDLPKSARTLALLSQGLLLARTTLIPTQYDAHKQSFTLILKVARLGTEHYLQLEYLGVDADESELEPFNFASECVTEEFDIAPGELFEHRILLAPEGEAVIRFKDLKFHSKRNDAEDE